MMEIVAMPSQPMLCILTRSSDRASAIATTIKTSLDRVLRYMDEQGIRPSGKPTAVFSDWSDRLVTIEAGYPVDEGSLARASGRIQAGRTPAGPAAYWSYGAMSYDHAGRHQALVDEARAMGFRLTGTTWEAHDRDPTGDAGVTRIYAQLLDPLPPATSSRD